MNKDEYAFLPEAFFGGVQEQEDEEELDPYFRPDAVSEDEEPEPDKPSDQNHGLSLTEAQWNFHSFGTVAPWKVMEN